MPKIVLVDDEENILKALKRALARENWDVEIFSSPIVALEALTYTDVDLVISDYRMPEMTGAEFLTEFKNTHPHTVRIILSGQTDMEGLTKAINDAEIYRFITKPWNDIELRSTIKQCLDIGRLQKENKELADQVRSQSIQLQVHLQELKRLERESPGITRVKWDANGEIDLSEEFTDN